MYEKRLDGRDFHEPRKLAAKAGIIKRADGSAMFQMGNTVAYAAVYGPRDLFPKFLQDPKKGVLRCKYNMMPFSGAGDRVKPGGSRRAKEISMVSEKALLPAVNLDDFPNAVVDVFIELPQTDAGTRCAGICAASMALADAGISMKDLVSAVSVGKVDDKFLVDLSYAEEAFEGTVVDMPVAMLARGEEISLLQMDGIISREDVIKCLSIAKKALKDISNLQRTALKEKFSRIEMGGNDEQQ